ncbi:hypothetical protein Tco_0734697, partial [Tanacetum coccineum]
WFGEAEESFLHNVKEDKKTAQRLEQSKEHGASCRGSKDVMGSTTYLIYRIPYVLLGLRIPDEEWRRKDTSLANLKVFGYDSFVKVKDVCEEAMKCTFIGSGTDEVRYSFQDTKSHQVIRSRDITFVDSIYEARSATDSSSLTKPIHKSQVVLVDITENHAENDSIVAEHGSFKDSGRSDEEYSEDGSSSKEGGSETPQHKSEGFQLAGQEENLEYRLKEIMYELIQAPRLQYLKFDSFMQKDKAPTWQSSTSLSVGVTTVEWESRLQKSITIYTKSLIHLVKNLKVGDEREVEVLRSFNWPLSELITEDGVLPEEGYSQFNDVSSGYLRVPYVQRYRKVRAVALLKERWFEVYKDYLRRRAVAQPQVNPDSTIAQVLISDLGLLAIFYVVKLLVAAKGLAWEARDAIKLVLGQFYKIDRTLIFKAMWREAKECIYIEPDEGIKHEGALVKLKKIPRLIYTFSSISVGANREDKDEGQRNQQT